MNLPIDLLRTFVAVAELGSFTRAGELLGRSQPAISLQIKRLEALLNMPLFLRDSRSLRQTDGGQELFEYARRILALNDEAVACLIHPKIRGNLHLGIPNEFAASFLPDILRRFAQSHPEVEVQVTCDLSVNLLRRLQQKHFDMVLALHSAHEVHSPDAVWMEDVVWVGAPGFSLQANSPLPLIVAPEGCVYRARIIQALNDGARSWRIAYTSPNFSGIYAGVLAGLGVTAVARSTVPEGLRVLGVAERLPTLPGVDMGLHYNREALSLASQRLIEHIRSHINGSVGLR